MGRVTTPPLLDMLSDLNKSFCSPQSALGRRHCPFMGGETKPTKARPYHGQPGV